MGNAVRVGTPDLVVASDWAVDVRQGVTVPMVAPSALAAHIPDLHRPLQRPTPDDLALIQFTSGSTAAPKGVMLTQRNLVAACAAIGRSVPQIDDRRLLWCNWLPLHHDMGLIGMLSFFVYGIHQRLYSPRAFIGAPGRWLEDFSKVGGNIYAGPNFSYRAMLDALEPEQLASLDLRGWRAAFNGAEPICADVVDAFIDRLSPAGFRPEAMFPVYGMAEATLAVSFSSLDAPVKCFDFEDRGFKRRLVSVGRAIDGHEIRVICDDRLTVNDEVGEIEVRGPAVMKGYVSDPDATERVMHDGWLRTGDLGLWHDGELYITGRAKDMIILQGRNIYATDAESAVSALDGVHRKRVAAFADPDKERIYVAIESRLDGVSRMDLASRARIRLVSWLETESVEVHVLPPNQIPHTTSGKVQRSALRQLLIHNAELESIDG